MSHADLQSYNMCQSQSSIGGIASSLGLSKPLRDELRKETRGRLEKACNYDKTKVGGLRSEDIHSLVRAFLQDRGHYFFSDQDSSCPRLTFKMKVLRKKVFGIMRLQQNYTQKKLERRNLTTAIVDSADSNSESDDGADLAGKKRPTPEEDDYQPSIVDRPPPPQRSFYRTRSNAQPGMPVLPSIEDCGSNKRPKTSHEVTQHSVAKRPRLMTMIESQSRSSRIPDQEITTVLEPQVVELRSHLPENILEQIKTVEAATMLETKHPSMPLCEMTPPPSSILPSDEIFPPPIPSLDIGTPFDFGGDDFLQDFVLDRDTVDPIQPEVVKIHLDGEDFKLINKDRALKVLQKLWDSLSDEFRLCRRNAAQASSSRQRDLYASRVVHLSSLLEKLRDDSEIWSGGQDNDPAVAML